MKISNQAAPTFELQNDFIWVHFPQQHVVHVEPLEIMLQALMEIYPSNLPLLLDLTAIDGFSVDAFELIHSLVAHCDHHIALLGGVDNIGKRYATLLEMTTQNQLARFFETEDAAINWVTH